MCNQQRVANDPGLGAGVPLSALGAVAGASRSKEAGIVAQDGAAPGLVKGDPELNFVAKGLEAHPGVVFEILHKLGLVERSAVARVEVVRQVPVEQGDHGLDACGAEVVDEANIVLEPLLVDGIISASEGDDAGPGEGEAVGFGPAFFEQGNVFGGAVVGVAGNVARAAICYLAGDAAEGVPDGVCAAIFMGTPLNLITGRNQARSATWTRKEKVMMPLPSRVRAVWGLFPVGGGGRRTNLAVANPHRNPLGRYESDMSDTD